MAGFYHAFGVSLSSARLPIAIGAMIMLATAFVLGRVAFSTNAGWWAAITLAATPRFLLFARRIIIDVYSSMFLGLTLLFFVLAEIQPKRRGRWLAAMYAAIGLGVITKGPIAFVLPALVFPLYLAATGRVHTVRAMAMPAGSLIVAAIVLPYYVALYFRFGWEYISTFLLRENLARYAEGVGAPDRGPFFYLPVVFTDLYFPWSLLLPVALAFVPWRRLAERRGWRGVWGTPSTAPVSQSDVRLLLGLWIAVIVAFYSASSAQQDLYVLPVIVAAAALVGGLIDRIVDASMSGTRLVRWGSGALAVLCVVLAALGVLVAWYVGRPSAAVPIAGTASAGALLIVASLAALGAIARRSRLAAVALVAGAMAISSWIVVFVSLPDFERYKPVQRLAKVIRAQRVRHLSVGMYKVAAPSLVFYLRRQVDQMFDEAQFADFLARNDRAYVLIHDDDFRRLDRSLRRQLRVVGSAVRLSGRLTDFLEDGPLPRMFVVTNEPRPDGKPARPSPSS